VLDKVSIRLAILPTDTPNVPHPLPITC